MNFFWGVLLMISVLQASDSVLTLHHIATAEQFDSLSVIATDAYVYLSSAPKDPEISRFIFIRHGESTSNAEKCIAGRTQNVDLSEKGKTQASKAGERLGSTNCEIHALYSSPSIRAQNTASRFYEGMTIVTDERLYEKFYGPYEGANEEQYQPVKELEEGENSGGDKLFIDKFKFKAHPEMESMSDIHVRVTQFLLEKEDLHKGENVIVATHNGVMKSLFMASLAEMGFDVDYRSFILGNASVLVIEVGDFGVKVKAATGLSYKCL